MKKILKKSKKHLLLFIIILSYLCGFIFSSWFLQGLNNHVNDNFLKLKYLIKGPQKQNSNLTLFNIDDEDTEKLEIQDGDRTVFSQIIQTLINDKPKTILFDIVFSNIKNVPGDKEFAGSSELAGNIFFLLDIKRTSANTVTDPYIKAKSVWKLKTKGKGQPDKINSFILSPELARAAAGMGAALYSPDTDDIIRSISLVYAYGAYYVPSLVLSGIVHFFNVKAEDITIYWGKYLELANAAPPGMEKRTYRIPIDRKGKMIINYSGPWKYSMDSLSLRNLYNEKNNFFTDTIVLIGDITTEKNDIAKSPFDSRLPKSGILGFAINTILTGQYISKPGIMEQVFVSLFLIMSVWGFVMNCRILRFTLFSALILILLTSVYSVLFIYGSHFPDIVMPVSGYITAFLCIISYYIYKMIIKSSNIAMLTGEQNKAAVGTINANDPDDKIDERIARFLNFTHDSKNPLTLINDYLEKDIRERGSSGTISIIKENIMKLKQAMIHYLDTEKVRNEHFIYNHNQFTDFSQILERNLNSVKVFSDFKHITIHSNITPGLFIKADPYAVESIIVNLLENIVRYTLQNKGIMVSLLSGEGSITLQIKSIASNIAEQEQNSAFHPYDNDRIGTNPINSINGWGLFQVNKILDQIHGQITVSDTSDKGLFLTVTLPIVPIAQNAETGKVAPQSTLGDEVFIEGKHTLLIIEDNLPMLAFLQQSFNDKYNVLYARNGKEALMKIKISPPPVLIVSDIRVNILDKHTLYDTLAKDTYWKTIPFIFLSDTTDKEIKINALTRGAIDFMQKPLDIEELKAKVDAIVKNRELVEEGQRLEFLKRIGELINNKTKTDYYTFMERYHLSLKEKEVADALIRGLEYKEICELTGLSLSGVKKRANAIYTKCQVKNRAELINLFKASR